jgi:hypothetical protein
VGREVGERGEGGSERGRGRGRGSERKREREREGGRERERKGERTILDSSFLPYVEYRLYTVVPRLVRFIDQLTNWYVRFNRKRIKVSTKVYNETMMSNTVQYMYVVFRQLE